MHDALRDVGFLRVLTTPGGHAHCRCVAFMQGDDAAARRNAILRSLHAAGLPGMYDSCAEIYRERLFEQRRFTPATTGRGALDAAGRLLACSKETGLPLPAHAP